MTLKGRVKGRRKSLCISSRVSADLWARESRVVPSGGKGGAPDLL